MVRTTSRRCFACPQSSTILSHMRHVSYLFHLVPVKQSRLRKKPAGHGHLSRNLARGGLDNRDKQGEEELFGFVQHARGSPKSAGKSATEIGNDRGFYGSYKSGKMGKGIREGRSHLSYCNGCIFSIKYDGPSFLQITNGFITANDQVVNSPDDIAICDGCKCTATNSQVVMMSAEAECDPWNYVDVIEFTSGTTLETGDIDVVCPDVTWFASAACDVYTMNSDGSPRALVTDPVLLLTVFQIILEGPIVNVQIDAGYYLDCTVVCSNPNPPRLPPSSKSGGMMGKGKSRTPNPTATPAPSPFEFNARSASKSAIKDLFQAYDPFVEKFPL